MSAPPPSNKDGMQVLRHAFDDGSGRIRTDAVISPGGSDLEIQYQDDSIAIGDPASNNILSINGDGSVKSRVTDGTDTLAINADGSINVNLPGGFDVEIDAADGDNIAISDGTNTVVVNADGSLNITDNGGSLTVDGQVATVGINEYKYGEQLNVAAGANSTLVSHLFATSYKLRRVSVSGENIAVYTVYFNATAIDKRRATYMNFNCEFDYETGISIPPGTTVSVEVENSGSTSSDFNAQLLFSSI